MKNHRIIAFLFLTLIGLVSSGWSARVYVTASGSAALDNAVRTRLQVGGHTVTLGVAYSDFDGTQNLSNIDVVYLQINVNYGQALPLSGQAALLNFIAQPSKGIVTTEWGIFYRSLSQMNMQVAVTNDFSWRSSATATFTQATADPILNDGLPSDFSMNVTNLSGTESFFTPKTGATTFYRSDYEEDGVNNPVVAGWQLPYGGRMLHFGTVNGIDQVTDVNNDLLIVLFNFGSGC